MTISENLLQILSNESLEKYRPFSTSYRGNSASEKLDSLVNRYQKVIEDSKDDNSPYRTTFSFIHFKTLNLLEKVDIDDFEKKIDFICMSLFSQYQSKIFDSQASLTSLANAERDATFIIILELLSLLE